MEPWEELLGADFVEHLVRRRHIGISAALSVVGSVNSEVFNVKEASTIIGQTNPGKDEKTVFYHLYPCILFF